jgi:O-antigen/teichoic acid export membrane protein
MRSSPVKGALLLSLLNQVVNSGGNFAVNIYLARSLPLADFGIYGICYGICMLYVGIGNAIILTQMVVNMADKPAAEKEQYATRMLQATVLLGALTLLLTGMVLLAIRWVAPELSRVFPTALIVMCASVFFLGKEFFIRYAYLHRKEALAIGVSSTVVLVLCGGLAFDHVTGVALTSDKVLLLFAAGAAAGTLVGYMATPMRIFRRIPALLPDLIEAWRHGRWALGGVGVTWLQSQTYTYILALFIGPAAVGQANAARIFISPFSFLLPAINQIMMPRLVDLRESNRPQMFRVAATITGGLWLVAALYGAVLLSNLDSVARLVLGRDDAGVVSLVWIWCVVVLNQMLLNGGSMQLQVLRRFRTLTLLSALSAVVTIAAAFVFIRLLGMSGAIWAVGLGETLLCILIWKEIRRDRIRTD